MQCELVVRKMLSRGIKSIYNEGMSERELPTRDLKNSLKFTATVAGSVGEALKPTIQRSAANSVEKILKLISSGGKTKFK